MCWTKFWPSGHWGGGTKGVWPFSFSRHEKKPNVGSGCVLVEKKNEKKNEKKCRQNFRFFLL